MTPFRLMVVAAAVCAFGSMGCGQAGPEVVETETVVPVTTAPAEIGTIRGVIHTTGDVNPAPGADLIVTAPEPARIVEIPKAEGDRVRRGDILVRFEIPMLNADAASRGAEVKAAEARVQNAKAAQTRAHDLFNRGIAARKEVEDADREVSGAEAALTQALASSNASTILAGRATVRASFDGVIARRFHNPGDLVEASATDPVLRVIDPRRLQVDASVPIADVSRIVIGARARLFVATDQPPLALKVVSRPAAVEVNTAAAPVRLEFLTPSTLAVGTPVQVDIDGEEHANVVLIPVKAVVHEGDETAVFVAAGGKAERRSIVTGLADAVHVEVRSGIKAGELVITHGQAGLPDGTAISTAPTETSTDAPADEKPATDK